ncbi:MAG: adenylyl-sulfate kinase [Firmicutes bacterium ZCTH02-B6]|nr:MAG: adenylyl-sulfate kinase [Firmicutes bacterium ZCTH02-B6]
MGDQRGFVVWLTGLSGAGKSTIAAGLAKELQSRGYPVEVLDGDEVRQRLSKGLGFSRADRNTNVERIAYVAKLLAKHGVVVITAAISPYREARERARHEIGDFVEVYVNCPLEVCAARDVKGLYKKAIAGEIPAFTGVSDPYEAPERPEITVFTDQETPAESVARIVQQLEAMHYIRGGGCRGGVSSSYAAVQARQRQASIETWPARSHRGRLLTLAEACCIMLES